MPQGVLKAEDLGNALQGLDATKVGDTTEDRLPEVFTGTLGGELVNAPIKFVLSRFAEFLGDVVDDNTAMLESPDDLPDLIHDFFADLPLVGIFIDILDAMLGNYAGADPALIAIQNLFALLRKVLELISGVGGGLPSIPELVDGFGDLAAAVGGLIEGLFKVPLWQLKQGGVDVVDDFSALSTVEEGEGWSWDEADGHDSPGCALFTATGTPGVLLSPTPVEVDPGEQYTVSGWAKATGASGGGIALGVQWYDAEHTALSSSTAQAVGSPSSSWTQLTGQVTVPAGAKYSRRMLTVEATAGEVRWDDVRFAGVATTIPQEWVKDLAESLQDVIDWVGALVDQLLGALGLPAMGSLFDRITDLADEIGDWLDDTQGRAAELSDLIGDLLSNPASVIGTLPQTLISNLVPDLADMNTVLNQIGDIFDGAVVTPVNAVVAAIKDWWNQWFGGESGNAIPLSQKGAANGVAPLNGSSKLATSYLVTDTANNVPLLDGSGKLKSGQLPAISGYIPVGDRGAVDGVAPLNSNAVVPLAHLPEEVGGTGGSGNGLPYVVLYLDAEVAIANNTVTTVAGWQQFGTTSVDISSGRWRFGLPGVWQINAQVVWAGANTSGYRAASLQRDFDSLETNGVPTSPSRQPLSDDSKPANSWFRLNTGTQGEWITNTLQSSQQTDWSKSGVISGIPFTLTATVDDYYLVLVRQNSGASRNLLGGPVPVGSTTVVCTYLGAA